MKEKNFKSNNFYLMILSALALNKDLCGKLYER